MAAPATASARALDDLYRAHVGDVYRYVYAVLGNHADAEDVTQTTFVNALRALERGERPRKPANWLLTIAHNVIRQRWRQAQSMPRETELAADIAGPEADAEGPELAEVVRALQRIPRSQREALVMRELEGRSYREIAEILGLTASALETLLFRARRSLAEELENLVTCDRAELAVSRDLDGRLTRKERRRLRAHLEECAACARFAAGQRRHRKAIRGLLALPLPISLVFWKGAPAATAGALPAIGLATAATPAAVATGAGGMTSAGMAFGGGLAVKAAAVVAAASVTAGVSYEGVKRIAHEPDPTAAAPAQTIRSNVPQSPGDKAVHPGRGKPAGTATAKRAGKKALGRPLGGRGRPSPSKAKTQPATSRRAQRPGQSKVTAKPSREARNGARGAGTATDRPTVPAARQGPKVDRAEPPSSGKQQRNTPKRLK